MSCWIEAHSPVRKIEAEARGSAKAAEEHASAAGQLVKDIVQHKKQSEEALEIIQRATAEAAHDEPQQTSRAAEAVREDPDASLIDKAIGFAISLQGDGRTHEAVDLWRSIARIGESGNDTALQERARYSSAFLLMQSDPEEAIAGFDQVLSLNPKNLKAYGNRGYAKAKRGDHQGAIADYDNVLELDPNYAKAFVNRGVAKAKLGDHQGAIADLDKAIDLDPHDATAYSNRGAEKAKLGQCEEAIADLDKVIDLDPDSSSAYTNRGVTKANLGDHREAISDHQKAIDLDPHSAMAFMNRGVAKANLGDHREAIAGLRQGDRSRPQLCRGL